MNSLVDQNKKISAEIIYELFYEIINKNTKNYLNNSEKYEDTVVLTLQSIGKIIKCFLEENKGDEYFEENNKIFLVFIDKCLDLMKKNSPLISSNILKTIVDLELFDEKLFLKNLSTNNWKIFNEVGKFIENEDLFINNYSKTVNGEKLIERVNVCLNKKLFLNDEKFVQLYDDVTDHFNEYLSDSDINGLSNLTLLDESTNKGYKNAVFPLKRKKIIDLDKSGGFVPICTKNTFLKYFSDYPPKVSFWTDDDREKYEEDLIRVLSNYLEVED